MYTSTVLNSVVLLAYIVIKLNYFWYVQKITGVTLFFLVELVLFIFLFFCVVLCFCTQDTGRRQTIQRHWQHWAHKTQDEDKQSRDTGNIGHTRHRTKTDKTQKHKTTQKNIKMNIASLSGLSILWFSLTSVCSNTHQLPLFGRGLRYSSSQEPYI
jgi:hypothetical protein